MTNYLDAVLVSQDYNDKKDFKEDSGVWSPPPLPSSNQGQNWNDLSWELKNSKVIAVKVCLRQDQNFETHAINACTNMISQN